MIPRRQAIGLFAAYVAVAAPWSRLKAAPLPPTPQQTAGPFYPLAFPADADNDLAQVAGRNGIAEGTVTYVTGRVLDAAGQSIPGARVEIWQCDAHGRYHYVRDDRAGRPIDENFQGYGQIITDGAGAYRFRTIRPVPYPGRTPHIHFAVTAAGLPASRPRCMSPASRSTSATACSGSARPGRARPPDRAAAPGSRHRGERPRRHLRHRARLSRSNCPRPPASCSGGAGRLYGCHRANAQGIRGALAA